LKKAFKTKTRFCFEFFGFFGFSNPKQNRASQRETFERVEKCAQEIVKVVKTKVIWSVYKSLRAARPAEKKQN